MGAADVLLITKPMAPPWNDGTLNLARCLIEGADSGFRFRVPVPRGAPSLGFPNVTEEEIYPEAGGHGTTTKNNLAMLLRLLKPARAKAMHFLFAPSARTGGILRAMLAPRHLPTIHTLCSQPKSFEKIRSMLFADHHIALSRYTETRLLEAGVRSVARVDPGVFEPSVDQALGEEILQRTGVPEDTPFVLYAGDLEFSKGAETVARALPRALEYAPHHAVFACREKTQRAQGERLRLEGLTRDLGVADRVHFLGTVPSFHSLLAKAELLLFPTANTYAKLDIPLVLLEALALGVPIVVAEDAPVGELLDEDVGFGVRSEDAEDLGNTLAKLLGGGSPKKEKSHQCRQVYAQRFRAELHAKAVCELYRKWI